MAIPTLGIKFSEFKPTLYNPTQYNTVAYDPKVLPQSMEKQYNWEQKGNQVGMGFIETLDKIRTQLNPAEYNWWDENSNNAINRIYDALDAGNAQSSIKFAQQEARKLFTDTDLKNKIEYNASREKALAKIDARSDINDDVKRASKLLNTYNYNGNVEYTPTFNPVASMSMSQIAGLVANLTPDRSSAFSNQSSSSVMLDINGNVTNDILKATNKVGTVGGGIGSTVHWKSADELRGMFYNVITTDSKINSALKQQYDVAKVLYNEANRLANDQSLTESERQKAREDAEKYSIELTDKDGLIPSYDNWLKRKAVPMIEAMAYKNISTTDNRHASYDDDYIRSNAEKATQNAMDNADDKSVNGGIVEWSNNLYNGFMQIFGVNDNDASYDANLIGNNNGRI